MLARFHLPLVAALVLASGPVQLKEASPGLRKQAAITYEAAEKIALTKVSAATVVEAELEKENGRLVYSFDLRVPGKSGIDEVQVDAITGAVVSVEHEDPRAEAAEKAAEKKGSSSK